MKLCHGLRVRPVPGAGLPARCHGLSIPTLHLRRRRRQRPTSWSRNELEPGGSEYIGQRSAGAAFYPAKHPAVGYESRV